MGLLDALLDTGTREPAACLIELGPERRNPGPLNALVKSVEIATSRKEAAAATLVFEDRRLEDGTFMVADSGLFQRWQPIRIHADFTTHKEEILRGYITGLKPNYPPSGGEATLELVVLDESALLEREHRREVWGKDAALADRMIVAELLSGTGITLDPASGKGLEARALSRDGPSLAFLRQRAEANGYEMIFTPGALYFGPRRLTGTPQAPILVYAGRATNCLSFAVEDDAMQPDQIRFETAPTEDGATPDSETVSPSEPALGRVAAGAEGEGLPQPYIRRLTREGDEPAAQARIRAQAAADEAAFRIKASGELDGSLYGHVLRPGRPVPVDGTGARYGGVYYVDKVTHRFTEDGYRQHFELLRNATGEGGGLSALPGPLAKAASALAGLF